MRKFLRVLVKGVSFERALPKEMHGKSKLATQ